MVLLDGRHRFQTPRDLQKTTNVAWFETLPVRCLSRQDDRPIWETKALRLSNLANKVNRIVYLNLSFVSLVKSEMNCSAASVKEHGASFLAARLLDIVDGIVLFNVLTGDSRQIYKHYIRGVKFFFFDAPISTMLLRMLIGRRWGLRRLVSNTSMVKYCSRRRQSKDRF